MNRDSEGDSLEIHVQDHGAQLVFLEELSAGQPVKDLL